MDNKGHKIKLNKYLALIGIGSRRYCEGLIEKGEVKVNNETAHIGIRVDPHKDQVFIKGIGNICFHIPEFHYLILNKPYGYLTTMSDPLERQTIRELIPSSIKDRIYPVGRLDFYSEGLLLLTNNGELANKLMHPSFMISKTYMVKIKGKPKQCLLDSLKKGIKLEDGWASVDSIKPVKSRSKTNVWFELTVHEGRNRLIRRMFEKIGYPVIKLRRISFAGIGLGGLKPGQWRNLTYKEIKMLKKSVSIQ